MDPQNPFEIPDADEVGENLPPPMPSFRVDTPQPAFRGDETGTTDFGNEWPSDQPPMQVPLAESKEVQKDLEKMYGRPVNLGALANYFASKNAAQRGDNRQAVMYQERMLKKIFSVEDDDDDEKNALKGLNELPIKDALFSVDKRLDDLIRDYYLELRNDPVMGSIMINFIRTVPDGLVLLKAMIAFTIECEAKGLREFEKYKPIIKDAILKQLLNVERWAKLHPDIQFYYRNEMPIDHADMAVYDINDRDGYTSPRARANRLKILQIHLSDHAYDLLEKGMMHGIDDINEFVGQLDNIRLIKPKAAYPTSLRGYEDHVLRANLARREAEEKMKEEIEDLRYAVSTAKAIPKRAENEDRSVPAAQGLRTSTPTKKEETKSLKWGVTYIRPEGEEESEQIEEIEEIPRKGTIASRTYTHSLEGYDEPIASKSRIPGNVTFRGDVDPIYKLQRKEKRYSDENLKKAVTEFMESYMRGDDQVGPKAANTASAFMDVLGEKIKPNQMIRYEKKKALMASDLMLSDYHHNEHGRNLEEILGPVFANAIFDSESQRIQTLKYIMEMVWNSETASPEARRVARNELMRINPGRLTNATLGLSRNFSVTGGQIVMRAKDTCEKYVAPPLLGCVSILTPGCIKSLRVVMNHKDLTHKADEHDKRMEHLLPMVSAAISSNQLDAEAATSLLSAVSEPEIKTHIKKKKLVNSTFEDIWNSLQVASTSFVNMEKIEAQLKKLIFTKTDKDAASTMFLITNYVFLLESNRNGQDPDGLKKAFERGSIHALQTYIKNNFRHLLSQINTLHDHERVRHQLNQEDALRDGITYTRSFDNVEAYVQIAVSLISHEVSLPDSKSWSVNAMGIKGLLDEACHEDAKVEKPVQEKQEEQSEASFDNPKGRRRNRNKNGRNEQPQDISAFVMGFQVAQQQMQNANPHQPEQGNGKPVNAISGPRNEQEQRPSQRPSNGSGQGNFRGGYRGRGFRGRGWYGPPRNEQYGNPQGEQEQRYYRGRGYSRGGRSASAPRTHNCKLCGHWNHTYDICRTYPGATPGNIMCPYCFGYHMGLCKLKASQDARWAQGNQAPQEGARLRPQDAIANGNRQVPPAEIRRELQQNQGQ